MDFNRETPEPNPESFESDAKDRINPVFTLSLYKSRNIPMLLMRSERIVVIEDEEDIQEVISYNLLSDGFVVRTARDGVEGLNLIKPESPDIVLLDSMLHGLDGLEVCRKLKENPTTWLIPIILVTAKGEETDVVRGLGAGAGDYVTKPFTPKENLSEELKLSSDGEW